MKLKREVISHEDVKLERAVGPVLGVVSLLILSVFIAAPIVFGSITWLMYLTQ